MRTVIFLCSIISLFSCRSISSGFNSTYSKSDGQELKHGYWIESESDTTLLVVKYKYGIRHGEFIKFDQEGNLIVEGRMKGGLRHGPWIYYHPITGITAIITYKRDMEISKVINGTPKF